MIQQLYRVRTALVETLSEARMQLTRMLTKVHEMLLIHNRPT